MILTAYTECATVCSRLRTVCTSVRTLREPCENGTRMVREPCLYRATDGLQGGDRGVHTRFFGGKWQKRCVHCAEIFDKDEVTRGIVQILFHSRFHHYLVTLSFPLLSRHSLITVLITTSSLSTILPLTVLHPSITALLAVYSLAALVPFRLFRSAVQSLHLPHSSTHSRINCSCYCAFALSHTRSGSRSGLVLVFLRDLDSLCFSGGVLDSLKIDRIEMCAAGPSVKVRAAGPIWGTTRTSLIHLTGA